MFSPSSTRVKLSQKWGGGQSGLGQWQKEKGELKKTELGCFLSFEALMAK